MLLNRATRTTGIVRIFSGALAVPCVSWYVVGCREVVRRGEELQDLRSSQAREIAAQAARDH